MGDTVVGICYRPPDQEEEVDEAFYRQLEVVSQPQALLLIGDLIFAGKATCEARTIQEVPAEH